MNSEHVLLEEAIKNDKISCVKNILKNRTIDINCSLPRSDTPLLNAVRHKQLDVAKILIQLNVDVDGDNYHEETPLSVAAEIGDVNILECLIKSGAHINTRDPNGKTPLMRAIVNGHLEITKELVIAGAEINTYDNDKLTPLFMAADHGHFDIAWFLICHGADVNVRDKKRVSPIMICAAKALSGHDNVVKFLIEKGANVEERNKNGMTPLMIYSKRGDLTMAEELVNAKSKVNEKDSLGNSPLHMASLCGHMDIVKYLLTEGAEINAKNRSRETPIMIWARRVLSEALENNHLDVAEYLIVKGAEVNTPINYGNTPLITAVNNGQLKIVKCLINAKADMNKANKKGNTPLSLGVKSSCVEIVKYLIDKGADVNICNTLGDTPLMLAGPKVDLEIVKYLTEANSELNAVNLNGDTALSKALGLNRMDIVKYLIAMGADVNIKNKSGYTPLLTAASENKLEFVKLLIEANAELNAINNEGDTALSKAVKSRHVDIVKVLIDKGADVNTQHENGYTPLIIAVSKDSLEMVTLLTERKVELEATNRQGDTALSVAAGCGAQEIVKYLVGEGADLYIKNKKRQIPIMVALLSSNAYIDCEGHPFWASSDRILKKPYQDIVAFLIQIQPCFVKHLRENACRTVIDRCDKDNINLLLQYGFLLGANWKNVEITLSSITVHDFLTEYNGDKILGYMSNEDFNCQQTRQHYMEEFPLYYKLIWDKIEVGNLRGSLLDKMEIVKKHCDLESFPPEILAQDVYSRVHLLTLLKGQTLRNEERGLDQGKGLVHHNLMVQRLSSIKWHPRMANPYIGDMEHYIMNAISRNQIKIVIGQFDIQILIVKQKYVTTETPQRKICQVWQMTIREHNSEGAEWEEKDSLVTAVQQRGKKVPKCDENPSVYKLSSTLAAPASGHQRAIGPRGHSTLSGYWIPSATDTMGEGQRCRGRSLCAGSPAARDYRPIHTNFHYQIFENGSLTIQDVSREDAGHYLCQATNGIGPGLSSVINLAVHVINFPSNARPGSRAAQVRGQVPHPAGEEGRFHQSLVLGQWRPTSQTGLVPGQTAAAPGVRR
ncbi:hypothetical protein LAZ67_2002141 [Cordylochernes scorpioides]|uniref:Alpha-latrotoxin n=1 Tax=Cordylochernes scorpioides TaxID=51811 RepID=A0ABY6K1U0_9ARAC|nr:hypothetical protein LAZ67_2002141 [Cordylochernes scorpioides]